jgi:hypothetical protein
LSLHILDLLENSVEAGASRVRLSIREDLQGDWMVIEIADNGCGMRKELKEQALDPFYTTRKTRHVGLGLPLLSEAARRCGGGLVIESKPGEGTKVEATFRHSHIDRAPLGDVPAALLAILLSSRPVDLDYSHRVGLREFRFDSSEIRKELEEVPLNHPKVRDWIFQSLREGEASLFQEMQQSQALPERGTRETEAIRR